MLGHVLAAIFGLIGVVVGALVTGGVDVFLARRHEEADKRQAKRMIATEIHTLWVHLGLLSGTRKTPNVPADVFELRFLPTELWTAHRASLARAITEDREWGELFVFYDNVTLLRWLVAGKQPLTALPSDEVRSAEEFHKTAATLYQQLTGRPPEHNAD